ncbi:amine oxidase [flavin-containing] B-like [Ptychodera flava]|uniref:amine oxidase [flavin-containing] B-like n=1 Tax=Ptychodera flava TaxID=63121 RepID=UPI00396A7E29
MANPWECANAKEWDSMTAKEWFDKICWCQSTKNTAAILTRTIYAVEPEDVSFLYFLWYLKVGHGFLRVMQTEDGAQERKFEGGSQQICEKIADLIGKEKVVCNSPVIKLEQSEDGVIVRTSDGSTYQAKHVISALAPTLLGRIAFSPPLPPLKTQLIQRFPMGSVIKAILFYENSYWSENGYNGTVGSDVILPSACDDTKPDGSYPAIVAFINGKHAREMTQLTKDERKRILCEFFAEIFESDEALRPVNYVEKNWLTEEFSGGCYVGVTPPGVLTQFGPVLREPYGRIYFAGTETATEWTGYMEGGVQAGERAAREVLHAVGKISKDEIWQDEPVSPDLPVMPLITTKWEKVLPSVPAFINFTIFSAILCAGAIVVVKKPSLFDAIKTSLTNIATLQL